jgi:hypothetical protein
VPKKNNAADDPAQLAINTSSQGAVSGIHSGSDATGAKINTSGVGGNPLAQLAGSGTGTTNATAAATGTTATGGTSASDLQAQIAKDTTLTTAGPAVLAPQYANQGGINKLLE